MLFCVGGENYLCLRRFDQLRMGDLYEQNEVEPLNRLFAWSTATRTGLRSDLDIEPPAALWAKACRQADLCFGKDCSYLPGLLLPARRRPSSSRPRSSSRTITSSSPTWRPAATCFPFHKAVVFDEAHQVEEVATDYLGVEITNFSVRYLLDGLLSQRTRKGLLTRLTVQDHEVQVIRGMVDGLRVISENFFPEPPPGAQEGAGAAGHGSRASCPTS